MFFATFFSTDNLEVKRRRVEPGEEVEPRQPRLKGTVRGRLRDSIQANASSSSWELRTLGKCAFPSRLEPTLSFAIFGNQLSLETPPELPQCESLGSTGTEQDKSRVSLERCNISYILYNLKLNTRLVLCNVANSSSVGSRTTNVTRKPHLPVFAPSPRLCTFHLGRPPLLLFIAGTACDAKLFFIIPFEPNPKCCKK